MFRYCYITYVLYVHGVYNMRPTGLANNEHISSNRGWLDEMIAVEISFHELSFSQEVLVIRIIIRTYLAGRWYRTILASQGCCHIFYSQHPRQISNKFSFTMNYRLGPIKEVQFRFANLASHFMHIQIFQIDFPLILSASKDVRYIAMSLLLETPFPFVHPSVTFFTPI